MADIALNMQTDSSKPARACNWCGNDISHLRSIAVFCTRSCRRRSRWADGLDRPERSNVNAAAARYRSKNPEKVYASTKKWRDKNRERHRETQNKWASANQFDRYKKSKPWREYNKDKISEYMTAWRLENSDHLAKVKREWRRRRAAERALSMILLPVTAQPKV